MCPAAPTGICGAVAAINAYIFLENTNAGVYGAPNAPGKLTPNYVAVSNTDPTDASNTATNGWQVGTEGHSQYSGPRN